jgi:hypothetical protein
MSRRPKNMHTFRPHACSSPPIPLIRKLKLRRKINWSAKNGLAEGPLIDKLVLRTGAGGVGVANESCASVRNLYCRSRVYTIVFLSLDLFAASFCSVKCTRERARAYASPSLLQLQYAAGVQSAHPTNTSDRSGVQPTSAASSSKRTGDRPECMRRGPSPSQNGKVIILAGPRIARRRSAAIEKRRQQAVGDLQRWKPSRPSCIAHSTASPSSRSPSRRRRRGCRSICSRRRRRRRLSSLRIAHACCHQI